MSTHTELIAEVKALFDEGWCICRSSTLPERVLAALESAEVTLAEDVIYMRRIEGERDAALAALEAAESDRDAALAIIAEALRQTRRGNVLTPPWVIAALDGEVQP